MFARNKQLSSNQVALRSNNRLNQLVTSNVGSSVVTIRGKPDTVIVADSDSMAESDLFNSRFPRSNHSYHSSSINSESNH